MKNGAKIALSLTLIIVAGATYYYFKHRSLYRRYHAIDSTMVKLSEARQRIANPKLN